MFLLNDGIFLIQDLPDQHLLFSLSDNSHFRVNDRGFNALKKCLYLESLNNLEKEEVTFIEFLLGKELLIEKDLRSDPIYVKLILQMQSSISDTVGIDHDLLLNFVEIFSMRKHLCLPFLQLFLLPSSTLRRALWLISVNPASLGILGDDDLLSVAITLIKSGLSVEVFDIDPLLLRFLGMIASKTSRKITCHEHNLMEPLRKDASENSVFVTEPDDWGEGFTVFVGRGFEFVDANGWGLVGLSDLSNIAKLINDFHCTVELVPSCSTVYFGLFSRTSKKPGVCPNKGSTVKVSSAKQNPYKNRNYKGQRVYNVDVFNRNPNLRIQKDENREILHCSMVFYDVNASLEDQKYLETIAENVIAYLGLEVMGSHWYRYAPEGKTGVYILRQSSLILHTWPELRKLIIDLTTCGENKDMDKLISNLSQYLSARSHKISTEIL